MGRLTEAKIELIKGAFSADPSYTNVARKLGVDKRTVMKHVRSGREETIQDRRDAASDRQQVQGKKASQSLSSLTFKLMKDKVQPLDIAIELGLHEQEYKGYHQQFLRLIGNYKLEELYEELGDDEALAAFTELFKKMKEEGMINQIQDFVTLIRQGTDLRTSLTENQKLLIAEQESLSKKKNELKSIQRDITNGTNDLKKLEEDVTILGQKWHDLDYNIKTVKGQLRVTQGRLDLLRNDKTHKKVINIIINGIIDRIKDKDEFIRSFTLATCIAFRQMQSETRQFLIRYSGQDRQLDEVGRSRFFKARDDINDRTKQELSTIFMNKSLEDFEDNFQGIISEYQPEEDEDEEELEEEENEE